MRLSKSELESYIEKYASKYTLERGLIYGVIMAESGGDIFAVRYEPGWKYILHPGTYAEKNRVSVQTEIHLQKCSWGLMQVMGTVARELGYEDSLLAISDPDLAIDLGCKKLRQLFDRHKNIPDAVSSYNMGSPRRDRDFKYYLNQSYVDKVLKFKGEY